MLGQHCPEASELFLSHRLQAAAGDDLLAGARRLNRFEQGPRSGDIVVPPLLMGYLHRAAVLHDRQLLAGIFCLALRLCFAIASHLGGVRDCPFELAGEPLRSLFARPLDVVGELLGERVGEAARRPLDDALKLVDLAALDVGQTGLDPLNRVRLLRRDPFPELAFAFAQAVGDLMQGPAPLALVGLQVGVRPLGDLPHDTIELGRQGREPAALLLARRLEPLRLDDES